MRVPFAEVSVVGTVLRSSAISMGSMEVRVEAKEVGGKGGGQDQVQVTAK